MGRPAQQGRRDIAGKGRTFRIHGHSETGQLRPDIEALLGFLLTLRFQQHL